jgi:hypothetical protein
MAADSRIEALFDPNLYLAQNPDVAAIGIDAKEHWLRYGRDQERKGLRPSWLAPAFAEAEYLAYYPDVASSIETGQFASAAEHWFAIGRDEVRTGHRKPIAAFDSDSYLSKRPDVAAAIERGTYRSALEHWLEWGLSEQQARDRKLGELIERAKIATASFGSNAYADNLSRDKIAFWEQNGFLILPGLIAPERCDAINKRIDRLWFERRVNAPPVAIDIYLERPDSRRIPMREAPGDARALPNKINDMVMFDELISGVALDDKVVDALRWILRSDPVAIGSLNFERGSTQRYHTDTLYMPGKTPGGMTAAWFALEDVSPEAGPLLYYPGSHKIPMFRFSSNLSTQINEEVPDYTAYMAWHVDRMKLVPETFLPKQGDVLIWHELLYHGGAAIEDVAMTRKSLVVHYWRADEMPSEELVEKGNGFWWNRPPLA